MYQIIEVLSRLVVFLNTVTKYPQSNNLREKWFILVYTLRFIVHLGESKEMQEQGMQEQGM